MNRATPSDALLRRSILAYERLARFIDGAGDPELGFATAFACGRRALGARAEAEAWLIPPSVVVQVEALTEAMLAATDDEVGTWLDVFPNRLLAILERRMGGLASPQVPRRRWIDRVSDGRLRAGAPVPPMAHASR
jgi:hypothetical protein